MNTFHAFNDAYRSTIAALAEQRNEDVLLAAWQANEARLDQLPRGSADREVALGVRRALKERCAAIGITDPTLRIEWLAHYGRRTYIIGASAAV